MWKFSTSRAVSAQSLEQSRSAIQKLFSRTDLGFFNPDRFKEALQECEQHRQFFSDKKALVVIGLGGSSLGAKALVQALRLEKGPDKIHFLDNVDSATVDNFLTEIDTPQEIAWLLCSKSGGTLEVTTLYDYCSVTIESKHHFSIKTNTAVVTEAKHSLVHDFAKSNECPILTVPFDIGGRFSVFTPVGLFPLTFFGADTRQLLDGFTKALADQDFLEALIAALWESHGQGEMNFYSFQYCDRLEGFGLWLQQLWSESLGKAEKQNGEKADSIATFIPCRGASDQHSVLQQIVEGPEQKNVQFLRVGSSETGATEISKTEFSESMMLQKKLGDLLAVEAAATETSVREAGVSTMVWQVDDLTESSMAYLMTAWMVAIGTLGELLQIDAFNQPGVESGKVITRRVLSEGH